MHCISLSQRVLCARAVPLSVSAASSPHNQGGSANPEITGLGHRVDFDLQVNLFSPTRSMIEWGGGMAREIFHPVLIFRPRGLPGACD